MSRYAYKRNGESEARSFDFGINDERGRAVGYIAKVTPIEAREVPAAVGQWYIPQIDTVGQWFIAYIHTTRNGETYGAVQPVSYHRTADEAWAAVSVRAEAMRKRYTKKYAKGA